MVPERLDQVVVPREVEFAELPKTRIGKIDYRGAGGGARREAPGEKSERMSDPGSKPHGGDRIGRPAGTRRQDDLHVAAADISHPRGREGPRHPGIVDTRDEVTAGSAADATARLHRHTPEWPRHQRARPDQHHHRAQERPASAIARIPSSAGPRPPHSIRGALQDIDQRPPPT